MASISANTSVRNSDGCEIVAAIEQLNDGSWENVKTFTVYSDSTSVAMKKSWMLYKGYYYRCTFEFKAYVGGELVENISATSNDKWY